jgi:hypothetical protein
VRDRAAPLDYSLALMSNLLLRWACRLEGSGSRKRHVETGAKALHVLLTALSLLCRVRTLRHPSPAFFCSVACAADEVRVVAHFWIGRPGDIYRLLCFRPFASGAAPAATTSAAWQIDPGTPRIWYRRPWSKTLCCQKALMRGDFHLSTCLGPGLASQRVSPQ